MSKKITFPSKTNKRFVQAFCPTLWLPILVFLAGMRATNIFHFKRPWEELKVNLLLVEDGFGFHNVLVMMLLVEGSYGFHYAPSFNLSTFIKHVSAKKEFTPNDKLCGNFFHVCSLDEIYQQLSKFYST